MSYIPCIRDKYEVNAYSKKENDEKINAYWQGFLNDQGVETLSTYDFTADIVENFFENLEVYQDVFADIVERYKNATGKQAIVNASEDGENVTDVVNAEVFNREGDLSDAEIGAIPLSTLLARTMYECMMHWLDMHRDELGVSILDNMNDEEYEKIKEAVLQGERTNEYTKE